MSRYSNANVCGTHSATVSGAHRGSTTRLVTFCRSSPSSSDPSTGCGQGSIAGSARIDSKYSSCSHAVCRDGIGVEGAGTAAPAVLVAPGGFTALKVDGAAGAG